MSRAWVDALKQRRRETGVFAPRKPTKFRRRALVAAETKQLAALVAARPDATLTELREALRTSAGLTTIWRALNQLDFTFKKTVHADEQRRPDVAAERRRWRTWLPLRDVREWVFVDECGVTTPPIWRSVRGHRLNDHAPYGHWEAHTVVAALRPEGLTAPAVFDGPIDNTSFLAYVEQVLAPTLRPGDVVVLDNLAVHRQPEVRAAIEAVGASLRFLPRTVPISIPSNRPSRNSKRFSAPPGRARSITSQRSSPLRSRSSHRRNVATTSDTPAIGSLHSYEKRSNDRLMLLAIPLLAHHSFSAEYDASEPVALAAVVAILFREGQLHETVSVSHREVTTICRAPRHSGGASTRSGNCREAYRAAAAPGKKSIPVL